MKQFVVDKLVDRENLCNLHKERQRLWEWVQSKKHVVVYAPRNFGKTSLVKNITIQDFRNLHKSSLIFFVDLMGVKDLSSIAVRLTHAFEQSFTAAFPMATLLKQIKAFLGSLRPEISLDPVTNTPSLSLQSALQRNEYSIATLFGSINRIAQKIPTLIVIDEFQDIAAIPEAEALFRSAFQEMRPLPIILMGSKRHLLQKIFTPPEAPLASWGIDLEIPPIPYGEYYHYIQERFSPRKLRLTEENAIYLQDLCYRVPEAINMLCQQILELFQNQSVDRDKIQKALKSFLANREKRYETQLASHSATEETVLIQLAKIQPLLKPQSKAFTQQTNLTNRSIAKIITGLMDKGILEHGREGYRVSDPLFSYYLQYYR
jgi:hypothetical protein